MGLFENFRKVAALTAPADVASPWTNSDHLAPVTVDIARHLAGRDEALSVPALLRARNLICTTAARMTLIAHRHGVDLEEQPAWLNRTDRALSPFHRMLWTVDDLLFYGWSLWAVTRDYSGHVLTADRVDYDAWNFDPDGRVMVNNAHVDASRYILIPGIHDGILKHGAPTITEARALMNAVARAAETPSAHTELHQTNDRAMSREEVQALKADWVAARRGANGGVAFTTAGIEVKEHGAPREHLLIEGRNAVATDIARLCGIPAPMIDATLSGTSLSYSNTQSRLAELVAFGIAPVAAAVTARLGMDDVVPRGVAIRIDIAETVDALKSLTVPDDSIPQ